jgi:hypothetical protein
MAIRDQIMQMAQSDPQFAQAVDAMEQAVINMPVTPEDLEEVIELLEFVVQNPDKYGEVRQAAIDDEEIDESMLPPQFDMIFIVSLLIALYGLQDRLSQKGYARGGLTVAARRLQDAGRDGDTILAHINPQEAEMLRRAGGSGTINPKTGLREYKPFWKKKGIGTLLGAALPVVATLLLPGLGTAIGTAISGSLGLGLGATGASILGGSILGAGSSLLSGGNPLLGAVSGGLGGGLGGEIGGLIPGLQGTGFENIAGTSLVGAGTAAATGRNPFSGALRGALGAAAGDLSAQAGAKLGLGPEQAGIARGIATGGKGFGIGLATGMDPRAAAIAGGLSGLAAGLKPSQSVVANMQNPLNQPGLYAEGAAAGQANMIEGPGGQMMPRPGSSALMPDGRPGTYILNETTGISELKPNPGNYQMVGGRVQFVPQPQTPSLMNALRSDLGLPPAAPTAGGAGAGGAGGQGGGLLGNLNMGTLLAGGALLAATSGMGSAPAPARQAVATLPPNQQEYFNRPGVTWDWGRVQRDASMSGMSMGQYIATNFPRFTSGQYNAQPATSAPGMAQGGPLSAVARFARGAGTGRSDEIDAKLSDGEYVIDAETVAMLGDGSSKAGAQRLDQMREAIRSHKGKALAKGKFSPDAKSPLSYLKGVA